MKSLRTLSRKSRLSLALIVGGLTLQCAARAVVSVGIVPSALQFFYNVPAGGFSGALTLPVSDRPIFLQGVNTTPGDRGIGHVSIFRTRVSPFFLMWVGLHSNTPGGTTIAEGFSAIAGTDILFTDFSHTVSVEVLNASSVVVHNASGIGQAGNLLLIY